ncbi:anthrone oxygenase family protein [Parapedobacter tibetensis]|uniref:anthrone oxygenase family protein n=1 Tax=Parapedobacter tibetensis TaxID=2972951 RepID=UPI00214D6137|nr:anthrone oxygenase family protein [Parapedobacter tibetensis]
MALISGLFYAYSCSVNIGLGRLADAEYLGAMQSINKAILNPWFFASFIGTAIATPLSTWMSYQMDGTSMSFYLLLMASIAYLIGVFGVTVVGNIPLNESLDKFNIHTSTPEEITIQRLAFEESWNKYNLIRTLANVLALILLLWGLIKR